MKFFGWKAGRGASRPALSRSGSRSGSIALIGEWPQSYEAQVRAGYLANAIAQRAVRLVAEGVGGAPLSASSPELAALITTRSGGQALGETVAAQLLLHGIRCARSTCPYRCSAVRCACWRRASAIWTDPRRQARS
jgi:hypothetical protein